MEACFTVCTRHFSCFRCACIALSFPLRTKIRSSKRIHNSESVYPNRFNNQDPLGTHTTRLVGLIDDPHLTKEDKSLTTMSAKKAASTKKIASDDSKMDEVADRTAMIADRLKNVYQKSVQPVEKKYRYDYFYESPMLTDVEFDGKTIR